jgi:aspartokinase/homoserine dehydrogenase 1
VAAHKGELEVWKFGGASLADAAAIQKAVALIAGHSGPLLVVASALAGVTDLLLGGAAAATGGRSAEAGRAAAELLRKHRDVAKALIPTGPSRRRLLAMIDSAAREYRELCIAVGVLGHLAPRASDLLVSRGERLSASIVAAALARARRRAVYADAFEFITTDGHHGGAAPNLAQTARLTRRRLRPLLENGTIAVVPGFIGHAPDGSITTLGRGGSDLTATTLARVLGAKRIVLWKDGPGILTADPRLVSDARLIPQLHHREAAEVAHYGAKVLHPRALIPIAGTRITLHVRSFINTDQPGTEVSARRSLATYPVKALAFRDELTTGLIDDVTSRPGIAVVAVVGDGMAGAPGIAARVFSALSAGNINVVAIAQGSSERNISFAVTEKQATEAARRVHAAFQLSKIGGGRAPDAPRTDVVLLGFGRVGRALADQIAAANGQSHVRVVGLLDRSGYIFEPRGISRRRLADLAREKDAGELLAALGGRAAPAAEALSVMASHAVSRPVVVDVTSEDTGDLLRTALVNGFNVVLANKKPLAGSWDGYESLLSASKASRTEMKYEATVGAGLPIIDTFHKLVETGDRVLRIDGCVSGTLMYVVSAVSAGKPFSQAVREAVERGYAEPDPRDDLSGRDAARKALILARLLGYRGGAPTPDDLVPRPLRTLPLATFMDRLESVDEEWRVRVAREASKGRVLRYVVSATPRGVSARLTAVSASSPIGALQGTRNLVSFTTRRYLHEPLVISGPGAGAEVTAAGILNDIYSLGTA